MKKYNLKQVNGTPAIFIHLIRWDFMDGGEYRYAIHSASSGAFLKALDVNEAWEIFNGAGIHYEGKTYQVKGEAQPRYLSADRPERTEWDY